MHPRWIVVGLVVRIFGLDAHVVAAVLDLDARLAEALLIAGLLDRVNLHFIAVPADDSTLPLMLLSDTSPFADSGSVRWKSWFT